MKIYEIVKKYYEQPHRFYHTWDHIEDMFFHSWNFRGEKNVNMTNLLMMIAYHDAVYDPTAAISENENASMQLFYNDFIDLLGPIVVGHIIYGISCTIKHEPVDDDPTVQALLDLDLSGLGADESTYDKNTYNIRREYSHVSDEDWKTGRSKFLENMLNREQIFHTTWGKSREEMARYNMQRELDSLK